MISNENIFQASVLTVGLGKTGRNHNKIMIIKIKIKQNIK